MLLDRRDPHFGASQLVELDLSASLGPWQVVVGEGAQNSIMKPDLLSIYKSVGEALPTVSLSVPCNFWWASFFTVDCVVQFVSGWNAHKALYTLMPTAQLFYALLWRHAQLRVLA
jgi:hypothetical protein